VKSIKLSVLLCLKWLIFVQFVYKRHPRGNVESRDYVIKNVVEIFHQNPKAVAVRGDDDPLPGPDNKGNHLMPVGEETCHGVLQALGKGVFALSLKLC